MHRRALLISLFAGAILGIVIAGFFSLDLFQAILQPNNTIPAWGRLTHPGVAVTGLINGLGSSPTHEIIQAIQSFKQNQQAQSAS